MNNPPVNNIILSVRNLTKSFYALKAVDNVSFDLSEGEILGIIGPNGSGKTTLFNCISGVIKAETGQIIFEGNDISGKSMDIIAKMGIRRTFQTIRLFRDMSVAENIYSGFYTKSNQNLFHALTHSGLYGTDEKLAWESVKKLAQFFLIDGYLTYKADDLAYGLQRKVEIARAMLSEPKLLILDEPAAGMNDSEKTELSEMIRVIAKNTTVLMIEHDLDMVMDLCKRIIVLNHGMILAEGLPEEIQNNKEVITAYMGPDDYRIYGPGA
ncbi:MAG: ABC transporter ATP-binding protein [Deferribacteraceae bacterium]|jgi:branched-chain amino acid transport system ATP-binding protein|nr:ABC transporter ATP-binding protein [Deferribacteraceae bacterium]